MPSDATPATFNTSTGIPSGKLGMWIFLGSEVMFFTGLLAGYVVLRTAAPVWPRGRDILNVPLTGVNTLILICSSMLILKGVDAAADGKRRACSFFLLATLALGTIFLAVQLFEYSQLSGEGFRLTSSLFASVFYVLTGMHGLHVLAGLIVIAWTAFGVARGARVATPERVEAVSLYWHFVDLVWVVLFTSLYLI